MCPPQSLLGRIFLDAIVPAPFLSGPAGGVSRKRAGEAQAGGPPGTGRVSRDLPCPRAGGQGSGAPVCPSAQQGREREAVWQEGLAGPLPVRCSHPSCPGGSRPSHECAERPLSVRWAGSVLGRGEESPCFWSCRSTSALTSRATPPGATAPGGRVALSAAGVGSGVGAAQGTRGGRPHPQGRHPALCTAFCLQSDHSDAKGETGQLLRVFAI